MKYLLILEDWVLYQTNELNEDHIISSNEGFMYIIDMDQKKYYMEGEWLDIEKESE